MPARNLYYYMSPVRLGTATTSFTGGGLREGGLVTHVKSGTAVTGISQGVLGAGVSVVPTFGGAYPGSVFFGGGMSTEGEAPIVTSGMSASGTKAVEWVKTIAAISVRTGSAADQLTADKKHTAVATFITQGPGWKTKSGAVEKEHKASGVWAKDKGPGQAGFATTDGSTSITNQPFNLPTGCQPGDILLANVRVPGSSTITWPAGWTKVSETGGDPSDDTQSLAWRLCDGTEPASITVVLGTARRLAGLCLRIINGSTPEFSAVANSGGNSQPNGPSFSPVGGNRGYLWVSIGGMENHTGAILNTPSGYGHGVYQGASGATGANTCAVYSAVRFARAATEDPGVWNIASIQWMIHTVAIPLAAYQVEGIASAPFAGEGTKNFELGKEGAAAAEFTAVGFGALSYTNAIGDAVLGASGEGSYALEIARTGTATMEATGGGSTVDLFDQTGAAFATLVASGAKVRTAFPIDAARTFSDHPSTTVNHLLQIPGPCSPGDILIGLIRVASGGTITWPAGWTEVSDSAGDPSDDQQSIAWRLCDGTEPSEVLIAVNVFQYSAGLCVRITGGGTPLFSAVSNSGTAQPNGPSFSPAGGERNYLWLTMGGVDTADRTVYAPPAGYTNELFFGNTSLIQAPSVGVFTASRQLRAATEDPGAWSFNHPSQWMMYTVAVPSSGVVTTGTAASSFGGEGAKDFDESSWTGHAVSQRVASGSVQTSFKVKRGTAISERQVAGTRARQFTKTGAGVLTRTAFGSTKEANEKTGRAVLVRTSSSRRATTFNRVNIRTAFPQPVMGQGRDNSGGGTNGKDVQRRAIGLSVFGGAGRGGDHVPGRAIAVFRASGFKSDRTINKTGFATTGAYWGSSGMYASGGTDMLVNRSGRSEVVRDAIGASAVTYVETGTGVSGRHAYGSSFSIGRGVVSFVASGFREASFERRGIAVSPFVVRGYVHPAGTGLVGFIGSGNLKRLYANDNFANREIIDIPTGDFEMDAGPRTWNLAGNTTLATVEAGEITNESDLRLGQTLWWELQVPFTCVVFVEITAIGVPLYYGSGMASRGDTLTGLVGYADPWVNWGQVEGRGRDTWSNSQTNPKIIGPISTYQYAFGTGSYFQVTADTPLILQIGSNKWNTPGGQFGPGAPFAYRLKVSRLERPRNDTPVTPSVMETDTGSLDFDLRSATVESGWDWEQLATVMFDAEDSPVRGDVFFFYTATADGFVRPHITVDLPGTYDGQAVQMIVGKDSTLENWNPVVLNAYPDGDDTYLYAALGNEGPRGQFAVEAGSTYLIAVLLTWGNSRPTGALNWEYVPQATNDNFADREIVSSGASGTAYLADTRGATMEVNEPSRYFYYGNSIWQEVVSSVGGWFTSYPELYTLPPGSSSLYAFPRLEIWRGTPDLDQPEWGGREVWDNANQNRWSSPFWLRAGDTYYFRTTSYPGAQMDHGSFTWTHYASPPANDDFADRVVISGASGSISDIDVSGATSELGEPWMYYWYFGQEPTVWYDWTCPADGAYLFVVSDFDFGPFTGYYVELGIFIGDSVDDLTPVVRMSGAEDVGYLGPEIAFEAEAGQSYKIAFGFWFSNPNFLPGLATLSWAPHTFSTNTTFANAIDISGVVGEFIGDNLGAPAISEPGTPILGEEMGSGYPTYWEGRVVWYRFDAAFDGLVTFNCVASNFDGAYAIYEGDSLATLTLADAGQSYQEAWDWIGYGDERLVDVLVQAGRTYYIMIEGYLYAYGGPGEPEYREMDMVPQGRFTLSYGIQLSGDDVAEANDNITPNNLNYYPVFIYDGANQGPLYSTGMGRCVTAANYGATAEVGEPSHAGSFPATRTVWFYFTAGGGGQFDAWVEPFGNDPVLDPLMAVYPASGFTFSTAALSNSDNFSGLYPRLGFSSPWYGQSFYIAVDARDEGTFKLIVRRNPVPAPPVNDNFADAIVITEETLITGTTAGATVECDEQPNMYYTDGPFGSVWYTFTPETDASVFIEITANTDANMFEDLLYDVYEGTSLNDLTMILEEYWGNSLYRETYGFPVSVHAGVPVYLRLMHFGDGNSDGDGLGGTFSFTVNVGSLVSPPGDDSDDAIDSGAGSTPGNTDGAGVEIGEPDPLYQGQLNQAGGSVWHKYVAPAPGFCAIYTTRTGQPVKTWYRTGVWEGDTKEQSIIVKALSSSPSQYYVGGTQTDAGHVPYYEVREGKTYWIQVIRDPTQSWGNYDLHIDEYLETKDWSSDDDGFTSTTGDVQVNGGSITVTGSQDIADVLEVLPQYATVDLGANTPKWGREMRIYFEIRMIAGQCLFREHWYGGDDSSHANYASNDHINLTMRRLGILRARDVDGVHTFTVSLAANNKGENYLSFSTPNGSSTPTEISLGTAGPQHDSGWISIELVAYAENVQNHDGTTNGAVAAPRWWLNAFVEGRYTGGTWWNGKQLRYFDWGMWRHPSMIDSNDQRYVENNEAWSYDLRRMRIRNIVPNESLDKEFHDDLAIHEFDGFASNIGWESVGTKHEHSTLSYTNANTYKLPVVPAPDKPEWSAFRTHIHNVGPPTQYSGQKINVKYSQEAGTRRMYGCWFMVDEFTVDPSTIDIAGYGDYQRMGMLSLVGHELRITPWQQPTFCVAHLTLGAWYWVEVHVDAEVVHDVQCKVYINGVSFGTFSNSRSWAQVLTPTEGAWTATMPMASAQSSKLTFGHRLQTNTYHDVYFTNLVAARGSHEGPWGPMQTVAVPAASGVLGHHLPDNPMGDPETHLTIETSDGGHRFTLYNWMYEDKDPGPFVVTVGSNGEGGAYMPIVAPRFWEPYFTMMPTSSWEEGEAGGGNSWQNLNEGRTRIGDGVCISANASGIGTKWVRLLAFGQSVPVDAIITGVSVRVHRRGTGTTQDRSVQLVTNAFIGSFDMNQGDVITWATDFEVVTYGGPEEMWGLSLTPQDVNNPGFGVAISAEGGGTAEIDKVTIQVYFSDEGGPDNIGRGSLIPPAGLYNLYGDNCLAEAYLTGTPGGIGWPSGGWEPGGTSGSFGTHKFNSVYPLWLWQARGDKTPYFSVTGTPGATGTAVDMRIVRNPLVYPRFAWSDDNGATWTWIHIGEDESEDIIGGSVGDDNNDDNVLFLDNNAALDRWESHKGGWSSGLNEDRPTASTAYRYMYWHISYVNGGSGQPTIHAVNVWARFRGYDGYPKEAQSGSTGFRLFVAHHDGSVRRVGYYYGSSGSPWYTQPPWTMRYTLARAPTGDPWTPAVFDDTQMRVGFNASTSGSSFGLHNYQNNGTGILALTYEILIPAEPDSPPQPCIEEHPKYAAKITVKK